MLKNKINACMIGESVFKVGDYTSIAEGWSIYKDRITLEECVNLKIVELYYEKGKDELLPKFKAIVETKNGKLVNVNVIDLNDVRNVNENREELNKAAYDFNKGSIYCKGYLNLKNQWEFFDVGDCEPCNEEQMA